MIRNKHEHSISDAFFSVLYHLIPAWDFLAWGLILFRGILLRFAGSTRDFLGVFVFAPFAHPRHFKSGVTPLGSGNVGIMRIISERFCGEEVRYYARFTERDDTSSNLNYILISLSSG